jgi:hypothetical protein
VVAEEAWEDGEIHVSNRNSEVDNAGSDNRDTEECWKAEEGSMGGSVRDLHPFLAGSVVLLLIDRNGQSLEADNMNYVEVLQKQWIESVYFGHLPAAKLAT